MFAKRKILDRIAVGGGRHPFRNVVQGKRTRSPYPFLKRVTTGRPDPSAFASPLCLRNTVRALKYTSPVPRTSAYGSRIVSIHSCAPYIGATRGARRTVWVGEAREGDSRREGHRSDGSVMVRTAHGVEAISGCRLEESPYPACRRRAVKGVYTRVGVRSLTAAARQDLGEDAATTRPASIIPTGRTDRRDGGEKRSVVFGRRIKVRNGQEIAFSSRRDDRCRAKDGERIIVRGSLG